MKIAKNKTLAIAIATLFMLSMTASLMLIPSANAHKPAWQIPTYAYILAEPNPVGVGQTIQVYAWLDCVYGAAGGTTAAVGTNGYTASAALLANNYRFHNFQVIITAPDGTNTTDTFAIVSDATSDQEFSFTPSAVGTYTLTFHFPGQVYGANGDGYSGSPLINDTYLPSTASATLTVQQAPIPPAIGSSPLPTAYWQSPVYGENTIWYTITSNWLGSGAGVTPDYTSSTLYHGDNIGPLTSHVMWTTPLQFGGVVGGNPFTTGGSNPNGADVGVGYFEGSSYQPRFVNPIIIDGYMYYTEPVSFTGPSSGPTVCVNLQTGQGLWSSTAVPPLSFGCIQDVWNPDQHGVYPPILVAVNPINGHWQLYDAYTGDSLFNVTGVPSGANIAGPNGEQLKYVFTNVGTAAHPNWYLAEWNMSKLWQYDINPYTGGGSTSPDPITTSGVLIPTLPIPITGEFGTLPNGASVLVPYGSSITVNANIPMNSGAYAAGTTTPIKSINHDSLTTYDWNISVPWLNTMPPPYDTVNPVTGQLIPPAPGANPVTIQAVNYGDLMVCMNGSLPVGFDRTNAGYPQLPFTLFAVNLNASVGAIGSILWMKTYNPPAGTLTVLFDGVDFQTRVFLLSYTETMQWVGYSLTNGNLIWGPTTTLPNDFNYYSTSYTYCSILAYGNLYFSGYAGVVYCRSDTTGALEWTYGNGGEGNTTNAGFTTPYGDYPTNINSVANGVIYICTEMHTITDPIYKGCTSRAINATTGQQIWILSDYCSEWTGPGTQWVAADGYATFMNGYDNNIYSVGRGPSATTVTAPDVGATTATPVVIRGTVMDISAGTQQSEQKADFPNGVPCASDASMEAWMGYVYQQQPEPTTFTGVQVTISVTDSNGNHYNIGTTTTNALGEYGLTWTPIITGNYTVYATFAGTNGYWPSSASTYFYAGTPAPTPAPTASPPTGLASTSSLMLGVAAIIIVIVIIGVAILAVLLRKRP